MHLNVAMLEIQTGKFQKHKVDKCIKFFQVIHSDLELSINEN